MTRSIYDIWKRIPPHFLPGVDADDCLHSVCTESGFEVVTYATRHTDNRGQTGIAVTIWDRKTNERVVWTGTKPEDLVYGSPMHADDSDKCLVSCIALCCYTVTHDDSDNLIVPTWNVEILSDESALMEDYLDNGDPS